MALKQISKNNISDQVLEQIKSNILSGEWKPGERIPSENELKDTFGVSRNSVRAAIQKLIALGLLTSKHGEGTFVNDLSPGMYMNALIPMLILDKDGLLEILEFRRIIEVESVKLAAKRATPKDIEELEAIIDEMDQMTGSNYNPKRFATMDSYFHEVLVRCAGNSVLIKVNSIIKELLISNQIEIQKLIGPALAFKYHPLILQAVKNRDPLTASKIMEEHIEVTIENVKNLGILQKDT